jgi:hypothetical protein
MIPFLAQAATPIIQSLMANGLTTLADAVAAKGKEAVENIIGVKLGDQVRPEDALLLKQLEFDHEEKLRQISLEERKLDVAAEQAAGEAVTKRWEADLRSDSWLSKNIRPMVLIYLLGAYTMLSLMSAFGLNVNESYVSLLGQWGMLVMSAYFVGRTAEKVMNSREVTK